MKNQAFPPHNTQSGSIFIWIFIMIALFGALSYAMLQGSRTGTGTLSAEQTRLALTELMTSAKAFRDAVQTARINGCKDTQISFEGETTSASLGYNYYNANAPTTYQCHIFKPQGGGITTPPMPKVLSGLVWYVNPSLCYEGVGTGPPTGTCIQSAKELELNVTNIPKELCLKINEMAGIPPIGGNPPSENYNTASYFTGTYGSVDNATFIIEGIGASGKMFGCYTDNTGTHKDQHVFYYILLAR